MTRPATDPTLRLDLYLQALSQLRAGADPLVSVILFGSTAQGTFVAETSDVDLFIVLPDSARPEDRVRIRQEVADLEIAHGFRLPASRPKNPLAKFAEKTGPSTRKRGHPRGATGWYLFSANPLKSTTCRFPSAQNHRPNAFFAK